MDPGRVSAVEVEDDRSARFEAFYGAHRQSIAAYVRRRVIEHDVEDVIAQVFLVAWRRFETIPPPPGGRLWLFGVARRMVGDHRRLTIRRRRLNERLAGEAKGGRTASACRLASANCGAAEAAIIAARGDKPRHHAVEGP